MSKVNANVVEIIIEQVNAIGARQFPDVAESVPGFFGLAYHINNILGGRLKYS